MPKLTALRLKSLPDGRYSDGGGLYVRKRGAGLRWIFRYQRDGKVRDVVLGGPEMTLQEARERAAEARKGVRAGKAPAVSRTSSLALGEAVEEWLRYSAGGWRSRTELGHARNQLQHHFGGLYGRDISSLTKHDIAAVLKPVWSSPAVANRLLSRVSRVFGLAVARDQLQVNPADPRTIRFLLPKRRHVQQHHAAVGVDEAPAVYGRLAGRDTLAARCLMLVALTAVRSGEARGAAFRRWRRRSR